MIAMLLTFASGASDVASFTRLGGVFTSVMTGNMVVFGLSLARGSVLLAAHTVAAVAGYVLGVGIGTRIAWHHATRRPRAAGRKEWPPHITLVLLTEFALFAGVIIGYAVIGITVLFLIGYVLFFLLIFSAAGAASVGGTLS